MINRRNILKSIALLSGIQALPAAASGTVNRKVELGSLLTKAVPSSGEHIPVIGIGTNRYGVGNDTEAITPLRAVLAKYAEFGGGMIDTAPGYRNSESVLGNLIAELGLDDQFFISTKCDTTGGAATAEQVAASQRKLKSGKLDLVSVHSIRNWQDQLPVLQNAKAEGQIRYVGITTSRNRQFKEVGDIMQSEKIDFVQLNYSLKDREAEQRLLKIAADKGIAVVANLAFGRGKLFSDIKGRTLPAWASDFDANSWGQLFLKYVVSHPAVTCAIPGTTKLHHLLDNLGAAQGRLPSAEQRIQIEQYFNAL